VTGFSGNDSFTYAAGDGQVESGPATVSFTVAPAPSADSGGGTTTSTSPTAVPVAPAPAGTPTTPPTSAAEPALKLVATFAGKARLGALLRNGLTGRLRCGKTCTVKVTLKIPRSVARRLHLKTIVGRATVRISGSASKRVRIRLTRSARKALNDVKSVALTLAGSASDGAGNRSSARKKIAVKR
jgi:hypothetical protein